MAKQRSGLADCVSPAVLLINLFLGGDGIDSPVSYSCHEPGTFSYILELCQDPGQNGCFDGASGEKSRRMLLARNLDSF